MPTDREVTSCLEAYSHAPWGEVQSYDEVEDFLQEIRVHKDGFAREFRQSPSEPPYLYIHGINYQNHMNALIEHEFTGEQAFWRARDKALIEDALNKYGSALYIKNIHADKTVPIDASNKPRLKVLPGLIDELLTGSGSEAVVLFTNHATAVYRTITELSSSQFQVESIDYGADCTQARFNQNHNIDYLTLFTIGRR
jgi:hypothetical protein